MKIKIFKVMKICLQNKILSFSFGISFNDKYWRSHLYIYILNMRTWQNNKEHNKTIQFKQHFATISRHLTQNYSLRISNQILV